RARRGEPAARGGVRHGSGDDHARLPARRPPVRRARGALMLLSRGVRIALRLATAATLAFVYLPIALIILYSFNSARVASWPIAGLTLDWYGRALATPGVRT